METLRAFKCARCEAAFISSAANIPAVCRCGSVFCTEHRDGVFGDAVDSRSEFGVVIVRAGTECEVCTPNPEKQQITPSTIVSYLLRKHNTTVESVMAEVREHLRQRADENRRYELSERAKEAADREEDVQEPWKRARKMAAPAPPQ